MHNAARRQAEHAWLNRLQETGDFYRYLLSVTTEGVWVVDQTARTVFANEHMATMLGYTVVEMYGMHAFSFMDEEGRRAGEARLDRRHAGVSEQHECKLLHKDGSEVWVLVSANPLYDEHGRFVGSLGMVNDITLRKRAEAALLEANRELELRVAERTRELNEANQRLLELVARDPLTNLYNRRSFDERLLQEVASGLRYGTPVALLLLDIDHFKSINDTYGHPTGDAVLRTVGNALTDSVRQCDIVARIGGEEFAVMAPQTPADGALVLAERIRRAVEQRSASHAESRVTVSVGVAAMNTGETPTTLVYRADQALYAAKQAGRNRVHVAELEVTAVRARSQGRR